MSCLSEVRNSIDSGTSLVYVYEHHNIGKPASTLTPPAYLNVQLEALVEHIMV